VAHALATISLVAQFCMGHRLMYNPDKGMWLVAETTQGVFLEYWKHGAAVVSLEPGLGMTITQLELIRTQFENLNLTPRHLDSFSRETQD